MNLSVFDWASMHPVIVGVCLVALGAVGLFVLYWEHFLNKRATTRRASGNRR